MTLQQLQYLMEVYRTGSVSGAAKNLFLAQSSLSASISSLENELGFPVFIRSKSGMIPTVQGMHVIEQTSRICESYRIMMDVTTSAKTHIRISAPSYEPLNKAFSQLISFYTSDPGVFFSVDCFSTAQTVKKLAAFELDVAILMNHEARLLAVQTLLKSNGLEYEQLGSIPVVAQIGPKHPLYNQNEITPEQLSQSLFIDNLGDPLVDNEYLKGVIRLNPEQTVSVKSAHTRKLLLSEGLGYTIGTGIAQNEAEACGLRSIPLPGVTYTLSVVMNPKRPLTDPCKKYIQLVKQALQ